MEDMKKPRFDTASPPLSELAQRAAREQACIGCMADREFRHPNGKYYCCMCPMFMEFINDSKDREPSR